MNKIIILSLVAMAVAIANGQGGFGNAGLRRLGQANAASKTALNAGDRSQFQEQAALNKAARKQARLDAKQARAERKQQRAAKKEAARLAAANRLDFENYKNAAEFSNTDAAADVSKANRLAFTLTNENRFDESARLAHSDGAQANTGTRLSAAEQLQAEQIAQAEAEKQAELLDNSALSAAGANEDLLQAKQGLNKGQESVFQFQDFNNAQFGAQDQFGANQGFGFGNGFFGNGFGRRR